MRKSYITHHHIISSLGFDSTSNFENLKLKQSGIREHQRENGNSYWSSRIDLEKVESKFSKIGSSEEFTTLEKMMLLSIHALLQQSGLKITDRTGLIVATTKGNVDVLNSKSPFNNTPQRAYLSELGNQIKQFFNFKEEAIVLSNACVSGVLAIAVADRLIKTEAYDDVVIVGGDLVSEFVLSGFTSFQAISDQPCKPYSKNRTGITIGEAIASVIVSSAKEKGAVEVIGTASSNDANHISGPSRTGEGLVKSIESALDESGIAVSEIDYISAHGTATNYNDEMEAIAFDRLKMSHIPMNSLKGYYGHTLGASGLLETIIGIESLNQNTLIASKGFDEIGVSRPINVIEETKESSLNIFLKTASGFGGCNSAVLFKKV